MKTIQCRDYPLHLTRNQSCDKIRKYTSKGELNMKDINYDILFAVDVVDDNGEIMVIKDKPITEVALGRTNEYKIFSKALKTAKDLAKMSKNFKIIRENTIQVTPMFVVESADKQESCGLGRVELIVDNNGEVIPVEDSMFESQAEILKAK